MEHALSIDPGHRWVEIRYSGLISSAAIRANSDLLLKTRTGRPGLPQLIDWNGARFGHFDPVEAAKSIMPALHARLGREGAPTTPQLVAHICSDPFKQVALKFWLALATAEARMRIRLFQTRDQAIDWVAEKSPRGRASAM